MGVKNRLESRVTAAAAAVPHEIADRLLARLQWMKMSNPARVLSCEALESGYVQNALRAYYPAADIVDVNMHDSNVDCIVAHLTLPWVRNLHETISAYYQWLRPNGLLLFSTLGPDTFKELRATFQSMDQVSGLLPFVDMHNVGDLLVQQGFEDAVVDMDYLTVCYPSVLALVRELQTLGVTNLRADRLRGLTGRRRWEAMIQTYETQWRLDNGSIPVTVEVIYGQAWKPVGTRGEVLIPVSSIQRASKLARSVGG